MLKKDLGFQMGSNQNMEVGQEVRLHLKGIAGAPSKVCHGFVFCYDPANDLVILEEPHPQSTIKQDVRIIKLSMVDKVEHIGINNDLAKQTLPSIPKELLAKREKDGLLKGEKEASKLGKGVSREAQILFDTLDKTYRLKWKGKDMITELGIVIKPPYTPDMCSGKDAAALDRIRKVVETINQRIKSGELS